MPSSATTLIRRRRTLPDNAVYYHAAYAAGIAICVAYTVALSWRRKRVRRRGGHPAE